MLSPINDFSLFRESPLSFRQLKRFLDLCKIHLQLFAISLNGTENEFANGEINVDNGNVFSITCFLLPLHHSSSFIYEQAGAFESLHLQQFHRNGIPGNTIQCFMIFNLLFRELSHGNKFPRFFKASITSLNLHSFGCRVSQNVT